MKLNWKAPLLGATILSGFLLFSTKLPLIATDTQLGTEDNPYLISTEEELNQLRIAVNGGNSYEGVYFKLTNDLDFKDFDDDGNPDNGNFTPIGTSNTPFRGYFDGNQHTISNVTIKRSDSYQALFSYKENGWIKNLILDRLTVEKTTTSGFFGGLVGKAINTTIEEVGILNGSVSASSTASGCVGGLAGIIESTVIKNSYVQANITGSGIAGLVYQANNQSAIENSYFVGKLNGREKKGLVYVAYKPITTNSYWDSTVSEVTLDVSGGTPLTTEQFTTYTQTQTLPGFDFQNIWTTTPDSPYPVFKRKPLRSGTEESDMTVTGNIQPLVLSIDVPTSEATFVLNPNGLTDQQFVAPTLEFTNQSNSPLTMEVKEFVQTTDVVTDVLNDYFPSWEGLNKTESKNMALALTPLEGDGWEELIKSEHYVAENISAKLGIIHPHQTVSLTFKAFHGTAFSEALLPSYRLTFVFGLKD